MPSASPSTAARRTAARGTASQRGFSLVELLVVIGIIATMTGLVLGGLFRSRDGNRLLAAEHVLADSIRQARHTARSTGSPVELRLTPVLSGTEVVGAKLAGVSRVVLWSETFDKERDSDDNGVIDDNIPLPDVGQPPNGVVLGRSGNGRLASADHPIPTRALPRGANIVRSGRTDGFYLACSVQPPRITGLTTIIIPLVMIGEDGSRETSQCGIGLRPHQATIQQRTPNNPNDLAALVTGWDLTGWVCDEAGVEFALNASTDPITTRLAREPWALGPELANLISGGQWVDVGLLYDGRRMVLYLNGQRIAERRTGVPATLRADGEQLHIGSLLTVGPPATIDYAPAPIDDIRLYRLGGGDVADLPGNVVLVPGVRAAATATIGWRILCQPDGRVEVTRDDDTETAPINDRETTIAPGPRAGHTATIVLGQLRSPGTIQNAELTVTLDGRVLSRLLSEQPVGAPAQ